VVEVEVGVETQLAEVVDRGLGDERQLGAGEPVARC
jgi:hypothetical protein